MCGALISYNKNLRTKKLRRRKMFIDFVYAYVHSMLVKLMYIS